MSSIVVPLPQEYSSFIEALGDLPDPRDPRGRRHELVFIVAAVVLAILSGRSRVSSIYRFIRNRLEWLQEVTDQAQAWVISRAQITIFCLLPVKTFHEKNITVANGHDFTFRTLNIASACEYQHGMLNARIVPAIIRAAVGGLSKL